MTSKLLQTRSRIHVLSAHHCEFDWLPLQLPVFPWIGHHGRPACGKFFTRARANATEKVAHGDCTRNEEKPFKGRRWVFGAEKRLKVRLLKNGIFGTHGHFSLSPQILSSKGGIFYIVNTTLKCPPQPSSHKVRWQNGTFLATRS